MRKWRLYFILGIIFLAGGYTFFWYNAADKLEAALFKEISRLEEKGYRFVYDSIYIKGFPFKISLEVSDPRFEWVGPLGLSAHLTGILKAKAYCWTPRLVTFSWKDPIEIKTTLLEEETLLKAVGGEGEFSLLLPGQDFKVDLKEVTVLQNKIGSLSFSRKQDGPLKNKNGYAITAKKMELGTIVPPQFPDAIEEINLVFSVSHLFQEGESIEDIVKTWYTSEAMIDIENLTFKWGKIKIEGNGTISLDQSLQPLGVFAVEIYGLDNLLTTSGEAGLLQKNLIPLIRASLSLLKETKEIPNQQGKEIYHKVSITLQDQELSIGPFPIAKLPMINWSDF